MTMLLRGRIGEQSRAQTTALPAETSGEVRALIVEDDPVTRSLLRHRLASIGCEIVAQCDSARDAWHSIAISRPDLVTLDIEMPEFDGIGAVELFRKIRRERRHTEVVIISASAFPSYRALFLKEGAFAYVSKPIDFAAMARQLRRIFPTLKAYEPDPAF
jgi:CheY-like chemotaxis protein